MKKRRKTKRKKFVNRLKIAGKVVAFGVPIGLIMLYNPKEVEEANLTKRISLEWFCKKRPVLREVIEIAHPRYEERLDEIKKNPIFCNPQNWDLTEDEWDKIKQWERKIIFQNMIRYYSQKYGTNEELSLAIARVESAYNPWAINNDDIGIYQMGPLARKQLLNLKSRGYIFKNGQPMDIAPEKDNDYFDPHTNIQAGIAYIAYLSDLFPDDIKMIAMAYKEGPTGAKKGAEKAEWYWDRIKQRMQWNLEDEVMMENGVPLWAIDHLRNPDLSEDKRTKKIKEEYLKQMTSTVTT